MTLRGLAEFRNVSFEMDDKSLRQAIDSRDDTYIRSVIRPKIKAADVCIYKPALDIYALRANS